MTAPPTESPAPPPSRRRRALVVVAGLLVALLLAANGLAFFHARAMTRFVRGGERTPPAQSMSLGQRLRVLATGVSLRRPENARTPADVGLAFETATVAGAGPALEAWRIPCERPRGGTVFLFHGWAASKDAQLAAARILHDLSREVVLVDFRGSGGSEGEETSLGWHEAGDVARAVASLARPGPQPVLCGTSMGAVAVLGARRRHDVRAAGLILESPFASMLRTVRNRFDLLRAPSMLAPLLVFWGGVQQGFDGLAFEPAADAAHARVPALLFHAALDRRVGEDESLAVVAALGPSAERVVLEGVDHGHLAGFAPGPWREAVERFLARVDGAR